MSNWPVFESRYIGEEVGVSPEYWEGAVVCFIVLVICSIGLGVLIRARGRSQAMLLVTSSPHTLSQPREYLPPKLFFPLSLLHTSVMCGMLAALLVEQAMGGLSRLSFWGEVGALSGLSAAIFGVSIGIYKWLSYTFGRRDQRELWFPNHYLLIFIFGHLLYLPLVCILFTGMDTEVVIALSLGLFVLFRIWSLARLLAIFNQLHRYPLHIFLYLCACEIGPLLFVLNSGVLSK